MPLYYFHLYDGQEWLVDAEGIELSDDGAVSPAALLQARDLMAGDIREGRLGLQHHMEVADEHGRVVHALHFQDAVTIDWSPSGSDPPSRIETDPATPPSC